MNAGARRIGLVLAIALATIVTPAASAIEFEVPLSTPNLTAIRAEFPVTGASGTENVVLEASLRFDFKGKLAGEATVDGAQVTTKGSLRRVADRWLYTLAFKGVSVKQSLKISGFIDSGVALVKYSGPRGKATIVDHPVNLQASIGLTQGTVNGAIQVDPRGKITGTGRFTSGYGNDPPEDGKFTGKVTANALSLKFKAGKQSIGFKGILEGTLFVGTLKVKAPPAKETLESFSIPVGGELTVPPSDDDDDDDHETGEEVVIAAYQFFSPNAPTFYGEMLINRVTTPTGKTFNRAYVFINTGVTSFSTLEGFKLSSSIPVPPSSTGTWMAIPLYRLDLSAPNDRIKGASVTLNTSISGAEASGTFTLRNTNGNADFTGTWNSRSF